MTRCQWAEVIVLGGRAVMDSWAVVIFCVEVTWHWGCVEGTWHWTWARWGGRDLALGSGDLGLRQWDLALGDERLASRERDLCGGTGHGMRGLGLRPGPGLRSGSWVPLRLSS